MRLFLTLALTVSVGCGSKTLPNGNNNGNGNGDGGSSGGVGGTGSPSNDMAKSGGSSGDMSAVATCDVGAQTGCPAGDKCVPTFGGGTLTGGCVPNGTAMAGQPCTPGMSNTMLNDNCVAGTMCDNSGPGSTYTCHTICTADSGCGSGGRCGAIFNRASYGLCYATCTLFGTGCPAGNDCSVPFLDIAATQASQVGFFVCKKTGTTAAFQSCQTDSDCAAGLACDQQAGCFPLCDTTHACAQPPNADGGTLSCQPLVSQPNGGGYCN